MLIKEAMENENSVYGYIAPTYKQGKANVWVDPNMLKAYLPEEGVDKINDTELYVKFINGSLLRLFGSDEPDAIRGNDFRGVFVDEFALHKLAVWQEILRPIIAQDKNRFAVFAFTPKGRNHAYDYSELAKKGDEFFYSFLPASLSGIIPQDELVKARKEMPEAIFRQEFECDFLDNLQGVFKGACVDRCTFGEQINAYGDFYIEIEEPKSGVEYIVGSDFAKHNDYTVYVIMRTDTKKVVAFYRCNETSWSLQKMRLVEMAKRYNNATCVPDSTGVGDPIVEDLERMGLNVYYEKSNRAGFVFTNTSKQQLIENLIIAIENQKISFPNIDVLIKELKEYEIEISPTGTVRYNAPDGKHDDCVIGLALALWGIERAVVPMAWSA